MLQIDDAWHGPQNLAVPDASASAVEPLGLYSDRSESV